MLDAAWVDEGGSLSLRVTAPGLARFDGADSLADAVRVVPADVVDRPGTMPLSALQPMHGVLRHHTDDSVLFEPTYPFIAGQSYEISIRGYGATRIACPMATAVEPTTSVVGVFPHCGAVPRNVLRIYVEFSASMSEGGAAGSVRVLDAHDGRRLEHALLPMDPELWSPNRRRLTVLFDPARIKRGLRPHEEAGYPLEVGTEIEVVIDDRMLDAAGARLTHTFTTTYRIGPDQRGLVRTEAWKVRAPRHADADLTIEFDRVMDFGLLERCITVLERDGREVAGRGVASSDGREWSFCPAEHWANGAHRIAVDPILEDVAGNSLCRAFDRDMRVLSDDPRPAKTQFVDVTIELDD